MRRARLPSWILCLATITTAVTGLGCAAPLKAVELVVTDDDQLLRKREKGAPAASPQHAPMLFLALDGVNRDLIYDMLRKGELPRLAALFEAEGGKFPHAYFDETLMSTMPSSTMAAWATVITGVPPSEHGVSGNEFFIREERRLAAPAPVSFVDSKPTIEIYTDGYMNGLVHVPTVYQRMRAEEPDILIWVALHHLYTGADRLLFATRTVMADAFGEAVAKAVTKPGSHAERSTYELLDKEGVKSVCNALDDKGPVPDVLTVYLSGTDLYAHVAEEGPDAARRAYLREVVDPQIGELADKLRARQALADRWVVLTSDHGHTPVVHDENHALSTEGDDGPPGVMRKAGYRVRAFKEKVDDDDDFNAVLAEGGATAFVYVANRSACPNAKQACDWKQPPRYEEDVLPMAEAFFKASENGSAAPRMKGTLDMILTRRPRPFAETDLPFEVYIGGGKTIPIATYLAEHPRPTYEAFEARMHDLAVGPRGERAGDIMLLAHNGDRDTPEERYYFAGLYRSWHGSPSHQDSDIPFIVANPKLSADQIHKRVSAVLGPTPRQQKVADVLRNLRATPR